MTGFAILAELNDNLVWEKQKYGERKIESIKQENQTTFYTP
jgi:hypothetical protein